MWNDDDKMQWNPVSKLPILRKIKGDWRFMFIKLNSYWCSNKLLCFTKDRDYILARCVRYGEGDKSVVGWKDAENKHLLLDEGYITHWMSLPSGPSRY